MSTYAKYADMYRQRLARSSDARVNYLFSLFFRVKSCLPIKIFLMHGANNQVADHQPQLTALR